MKKILLISSVVFLGLLSLYFFGSYTVRPLDPTQFNLPSTAKEDVKQRTNFSATFKLSENRYAEVFTPNIGNTKSTYSTFINSLYVQNAFATSQTFTSTGSWIAPCGTSSVQAEVWGGGQQGGQSASATKGTGGGAGGDYAKKNSVSVVAGTSYTVTVGIGGSGAGAVAGGNSWFNTTSTVLARGGNQSTTEVGDTILTGGTFGNNGNTANGGGGGGSAGTAANGNPGSNATAGSGGAGGVAVTGGGAGGTGSSSGITGVTGSIPGGGGGGSDATSLGDGPGNGARGQVILTWTASCGTGNFFMFF